MEQLRIGIVQPRMGDFTIPALHVKYPRLLNLTIVMRDHAAIVSDFICTLFQALDGLAMSKVEIVLIDHHSDDRTITKAMQLLTKRQSLYLMRGNKNENVAQTIFRAWQRSRATILGSIEMVDNSAVAAIPAMMAQIRQGAVDMVIGRRCPAVVDYVLPKRWMLAEAIAHLCGHIIAPDLFRSGIHPLSTTLLVQRHAMQGQTYTLHGNMIAPNIVAQTSSMQIVELEYPRLPLTTAAPLRSLRELLAMLCKIQITSNMQAIQREQ